MHKEREGDRKRERLGDWRERGLERVGELGVRV